MQLDTRWNTGNISGAQVLVFLVELSHVYDVVDVVVLQLVGQRFLGELDEATHEAYYVLRFLVLDQALADAHQYRVNYLHRSKLRKLQRRKCVVGG